LKRKLNERVEKIKQTGRQVEKNQEISDKKGGIKVVKNDKMEEKKGDISCVHIN